MEIVNDTDGYLIDVQMPGGTVVRQQSITSKVPGFINRGWMLGFPQGQAILLI